MVVGAPGVTVKLGVAGPLLPQQVAATIPPAIPVPAIAIMITFRRENRPCVGWSAVVEAFCVISALPVRKPLRARMRVVKLPVDVAKTNTGELDCALGIGLSRSDRLSTSEMPTGAHTWQDSGNSSARNGFAVAVNYLDADIRGSSCGGIHDGVASSEDIHLQFIFCARAKTVCSEAEYHHTAK